MRCVKGSFTVELSIIFPFIFLILMVLLQFGLYFTYQIYASCIMQQSLMICESRRQQGAEPKAALGEAEAYVSQKMEEVPVQVLNLKMNQQKEWIEEVYQVELEAEYNLIIPLTWRSIQKKSRMDPVTFRNRIDWVWEKGKKWMQNWEEQ